MENRKQESPKYWTGINKVLILPGGQKSAHRFESGYKLYKKDQELDPNPQPYEGEGNRPRDAPPLWVRPQGGALFWRGEMNI